MQLIAGSWLLFSFALMGGGQAPARDDNSDAATSLQAKFGPQFVVGVALGGLDINTTVNLVGLTGQQTASRTRLIPVFETEVGLAWRPWPALTISAGSDEMVLPIAPGKVRQFDVPARGVRGFNSYECLLSATSSDGFVPHLLTPASTDFRNLGVLLRFAAVRSSPQRR